MASNPILKTLRDATKGLLYTSEADKPLKAFLWPKAEVGAEEMNPETLRAGRKIGAKVPIQERTLDAFFAPMVKPQGWHGEEEKAMAAKFQALVEMLRTELGGVRVFRVGEGRVEVYVVGKTTEGDFAGVSTQLVET